MRHLYSAVVAVRTGFHVSVGFMERAGDGCGPGGTAVAGHCTPWLSEPAHNFAAAAPIVYSAGCSNLRVGGRD